MKTTFIYFLKDPENSMKGYVGKSKTPEQRFNAHLRSQRKWICELRARRLQPSLEIVDEVPEEHWQQLEVAYIEFFLERGYELVNETPGGEDPPPGWGRKKSPEELAKFRAAVSGERHWAFGKTFSPEHRARLSEAGKGRRHSPETIEKCRAVKLGSKNSMFGKKYTPAQIAVKSAVISGEKNHNFGKPMSSEQKAKISTTKMGCVPWNKGKKTGLVPWNKGKKKA